MQFEIKVITSHINTHTSQPVAYGLWILPALSGQVRWKPLSLFLPQWGSQSIPTISVTPSPALHNNVKMTEMTILRLHVN